MEMLRRDGEDKSGRRTRETKGTFFLNAVEEEIKHREKTVRIDVAASAPPCSMFQA